MQAPGLHATSMQAPFQKGLHANPGGLHITLWKTLSEGLETTPYTFQGFVCNPQGL